MYLLKKFRIGRKDGVGREIPPYLGCKILFVHMQNSNGVWLRGRKGGVRVSACDGICVRSLLIARTLTLNVLTAE